jgi:hypothetical protein
MRNFRTIILSFVALSVLSCGKFSTSSSAAVATNKIIFVTDTTFDGNIGNINGADNKCKDAANFKALTNPTNYKAMIVGNTRHACTTANCSGGQSENLDWVLKANTTYIQIDTTVIGTTNANGLLTFPLTVPIDNTPTGSAWTGLSNDWTNFVDNCDDWTESDFPGGLSGAIGDITALDDTSIKKGSPKDCTDTYYLYCVEQ